MNNRESAMEIGGGEKKGAAGVMIWFILACSEVDGGRSALFPPSLWLGLYPQAPPTP